MAAVVIACSPAIVIPRASARATVRLRPTRHNCRAKLGVRTETVKPAIISGLSIIPYIVAGYGYISSPGALKGAVAAARTRPRLNFHIQDVSWAWGALWCFLNTTRESSCTREIWTHFICFLQSDLRWMILARQVHFPWTSRPARNVRKEILSAGLTSTRAKSMSCEKRRWWKTRAAGTGSEVEFEALYKYAKRLLSFIYTCFSPCCSSSSRCSAAEVLPQTVRRTAYVQESQGPDSTYAYPGQIWGDVSEIFALSFSEVIKTRALGAHIPQTIMVSRPRPLISQRCAAPGLIRGEWFNIHRWGQGQGQGKVYYTKPPEFMQIHIHPHLPPPPRRHQYQYQFLNPIPNTYNISHEKRTFEKTLSTWKYHPWLHSVGC